MPKDQREKKGIFQKVLGIDCDYLVKFTVMNHIWASSQVTAEPFITGLCGLALPSLTLGGRKSLWMLTLSNL